MLSSFKDRNKVLSMRHKKELQVVAVAAIFLFLSCSREQKPSAALLAVSDSSLIPPQRIGVNLRKLLLK